MNFCREIFLIKSYTRHELKRRICRNAEIFFVFMIVEDAIKIKQSIVVHLALTSFDCVTVKTCKLILFFKKVPVPIYKPYAVPIDRPVPHFVPHPVVVNPPVHHTHHSHGWAPVPHPHSHNHHHNKWWKKLLKTCVAMLVLKMLKQIKFKTINSINFFDFFIFFLIFLCLLHYNKFFCC